MRQRPAVRGAALRPTPPPPRGIHSPGRSQARRGGVFRALPSSSPFGVPAGKPARAGPCRWPPPGLFCLLRTKARAGRPSEPRTALPAPFPLPAPLRPARALSQSQMADCWRSSLTTDRSHSCVPLRSPGLCVVYAKLRYPGAKETGQGVNPRGGLFNPGRGRIGQPSEGPDLEKPLARFYAGLQEEMRSGRAPHPQSPWSGKSPVFLPRRPRSCRLHTDFMWTFYGWVGGRIPAKFAIYP